MIDFKVWFTHIYKQYRAHQDADLSLDEYWSKYHNKFKKVTIGCSFAPDLVEQMYQLENNGAIATAEQKLAVLKVLIHDFGMYDIRLGVKWDKAVGSQGNFDFSYYKPYLDYCLSQQVNVCLNIGPIKTFGWPEEYIPEEIIKKCNLAPNTRIHNNSAIAHEAYSYLEKLLTYLNDSYTEKQLQHLVIIQPENEPFNVFGKRQFRLSPEYVSEVVKRVHRVFPDKKILLSSSETKDTPSIIKVIKELEKNEGILPSTFICGINYYYNLPHFIHLPKIGPIDYITYSNTIQRNTNFMNIRTAQKMGYGIEVTEAQFEQWGRTHLSPGNSFHEAKYLLARCATTILPHSGGVIRLWGFERYAKKKIEDTLIHDHKENLRLIQMINSRK